MSSELPPLQLVDGGTREEVSSYVGGVQQQCLVLNETCPNPAEAIRYRTAAIDHLMVSLYQQAERLSKERYGGNTRCCLVSQGGYGRRELCLYSDLDLLFFYEGRAQGFIKVMTEKILQPLWDAGLEVGFATRTVRDCCQLMTDDLTILTSLIDARHLAGSEPLFQDFLKAFSRYFSSEKNRLKFVRMKLDENDERHRRYGESSYLLEPNLKEGKGGLRDYHTIHWVAKIIHHITKPDELVTRGIISEEDFKELWESLSLLWKVRNELHCLSGRKNDQFALGYQEQVAHRLGFKSDEKFLGVEIFMQRYHRCAAAITDVSDRYTAQLIPNRPKLFPKPQAVPDDPHVVLVAERLTITQADVFAQDPLYLLKIFDTARRMNVDLDSFTVERIRQNVFRIDEAFLTHPESGALFRALLSNPKGLLNLLSKMHQLKVLGGILPEFAKLLFRVQHDAYHVYTVDAHSLFAVGEAEKLYRGAEQDRYGTPCEVMRDIKKIAVLIFGILYHDIGKGEGSGHVEKGAPLIRRAATRLGFDAEDVECLEFLERSHLIMTHLAFRRDLEEQNLIIQFAKSVQNMERLSLLYLLTFCDVKGVSPEAMTDWKASLLEYLFLRTREVLQKGAFAAERASQLIPKIREQVLALMTSGEERRRCNDFFKMMSARYLLATPAQAICRHIQLWGRFEQDPIVLDWQSLTKERLNEVTLFTLNHPGLFSKVTGVLAVHQMNILDAELATSTHGHAMLVFHVTDPEGQIVDDETRWQRLEKDLRDVLQGKTPIARFIQEGFRPSIFRKQQVRRLPTKIEVDNDVSAYYTVIDVYTHDRVGLLYQIISTLESLGLYVEVSKISTKVDQVSDVFYVKDIFGHKITHREKLDNVRHVLKQVMEEAEGA